MAFKYVSENCFVRESISKELDDKIIPLADEILNRKIQWYGDDDESACSLVDCISDFIDVKNYTADEFEYMVEHIHFYCGLELLRRNNCITDETANNLKLSELLI